MTLTIDGERNEKGAAGENSFRPCPGIFRCEMFNFDDDYLMTKTIAEAKKQFCDVVALAGKGKARRLLGTQSPWLA